MAHESPQRPARDRNPALDGFRAFAVLSVVAFHYLADSVLLASDMARYYPFGTAYANVPLLSHGNMGVQLFFMISGFVIALTLESSAGPLDFAIKRFARLFPAMLLCSLVTAVCLAFLPVPIWHIRLLDFLPGWTFFSEHTWSSWLGQPVELVDTVYWTLFIEVKFYVLAAVAFFGARRLAWRVPLSLLLALVMVVEIALVRVLSLEGTDLEQFKAWTLYDFLPFFVAGTSFYALSVERRNPLAIGLALLSLALLLLRTKHDVVALALLAFFFLLFVGLIYLPCSVAVFALRPMAAIGAWSYSLYLLHNRLGIALVYNLAAGAPEWLRHSILLPLSVGILLTLLAMLVFRFWETPARALIRRATPAHFARSSHSPAAAPKR